VLFLDTKINASNLTRGFRMSKEVMYVLCIPVKYSPEPPKEQKNCLIEGCGKCGDEMWVSEKKRAMREKGNKKTLKILCAICVFNEYVKLGYDVSKIETFDILETKH
jgi:hypothetical protein